jgi:hypothetical protein
MTESEPYISSSEDDDNPYISSSEDDDNPYIKGEYEEVLCDTKEGFKVKFKFPKMTEKAKEHYQRWEKKERLRSKKQHNFKKKLIDLIEKHPDIYSIFENPELVDNLNKDYMSSIEHSIFSTIEKKAISCSKFDTTKCSCTSVRTTNMIRFAIEEHFLTTELLKRNEAMHSHNMVHYKFMIDTYDTIKYSNHVFCDYCSNYMSFSQRLGSILNLFRNNYEDDDINQIFKNNFEIFYRFWCDFLIMKDNWKKLLTDEERHHCYQYLSRSACLYYQSKLTPEEIGTIINAEEWCQMKESVQIPDSNESTKMVEKRYSILCTICQKPYPVDYFHGYVSGWHFSGQLKRGKITFGYGSVFDSDAGSIIDKTLTEGYLCDACGVDLIDTKRVTDCTYNGLGYYY